MAHNQPDQHRPLMYQAVKASTAATTGVSLSVLSALTLTATVIGLVVATPVLVIFSPVLVPAALTVLLLIGGFLLSGGLGGASMLTGYWLYKYVAGKHPTGADLLDRARGKITGAAMEVKDRAEQFGRGQFA